MSIRVHPKCNPTGMKEEILFANWVIGPILQKYSRYVKNFWIRSLTDGKHGNKSLHYPGLAEDIAPEWEESMFYSANIVRPIMTKDDVIEEMLGEMRAALGLRYDVIYHAEHFHLEYQPK